MGWGFPVTSSTWLLGGAGSFPCAKDCRCGHQKQSVPPQENTMQCSERVLSPQSSPHCHLFLGTPTQTHRVCWGRGHGPEMKIASSMLGLSFFVLFCQRVRSRMLQTKAAMQEASQSSSMWQSRNLAAPLHTTSRHPGRTPAPHILLQASPKHPVFKESLCRQCMLEHAAFVQMYLPARTRF